jgi:hypothetical protein
MLGAVAWAEAVRWKKKPPQPRPWAAAEPGCGRLRAWCAQPPGGVRLRVRPAVTDLLGSDLTAPGLTAPSVAGLRWIGHRVAIGSWAVAAQNAQHARSARSARSAPRMAARRNAAPVNGGSALSDPRVVALGNKAALIAPTATTPERRATTGTGARPIAGVTGVVMAGVSAAAEARHPPAGAIVRARRTAQPRGVMQRPVALCRSLRAHRPPPQSQRCPAWPSHRPCPTGLAG